MGYTQSIEFCGVFPANTAISTNPDSICYDRFGNSYDILTESESHGPEIVCEAGYFDLVFISIDQDLQEVFCKVFEDLSDLVPQRTNSDGCENEVIPGTVRIYIETHDIGSSSKIMSASAWYNPVLSNGCGDNALMVSRVELKIKGGHLNWTSSRDGQITVNDDYSGENSDMLFHYDWTTTPPSNKFDAYSIILHEALHLYGFASSIALDGTGGEDGFFLWDRFLHTTPFYNPAGSSSGLEPLIVSNCEENCWSLSTAEFADETEMLSALVNNCAAGGDFDFVFGSEAIAPISGTDSNSPPTEQGDLANLLSHLHPTCNSQNVDYVMRPGLTIGAPSVRRIVSNPEREILCELGYFIVDHCDGCYTIANNENIHMVRRIETCCTLFETGCVGVPVEISLEDLICNDFSNDEIEITDAWSSSVSVTLGVDDITFTPTSIGRYVIHYTVKGCECILLNAHIEVYIGPCTDCEEIDPCENLVCLEDFEEYLPDNGVIALHYEAAGVYWAATGSENTLDICEESGGNNYLQIASAPSNREGLVMQLSEPIAHGCRLHVSFDGSSGLPNVFSWFVSATPPCPASVGYVSTECQPTDCGTHVYVPVCIPGGEIPVSQAGTASEGLCSDDPELEPHEFTWTNDVNYDVNYLILMPGPSTIDARNYIDNIVVTKSCIVDASFDIELIEECLDVVFTAADQSGENDHDWDFGDSNTSTLTNPTHVYGSGGTYNVTHTVTDECGNSETVVHEVVVGDCCENYTVTTNTSWTLSNLPPHDGIFHTLTIQHGAGLNIGPGVVLRFCQGGSLVIQAGATLKTRGTFTSLGDFDWQGVFVTGISANSQKSSCTLYPTAMNCQSQGFFWADEDAIIENALIGVRNYGPGGTDEYPHLNYRGGMIKAIDATFRNNAVGVKFAAYVNSQAGIPKPSLGNFTECQFVNNSNYSIDAPFSAFVSMNGVEGMRFYGCTFDNDLSLLISNSYDNFGKGIEAFGSEFAVKANGTVPDIPGPCLPGDCTVLLQSTFTGLAHGIYISNNQRVRPYSIMQCVFEDCYRGITSIYTPGGTILFNEFLFEDVPFHYSDPQYQIGVYLAFDHPGFELQENTFVNDPEGLTESIGIICNGIGGAPNIIRRNTFDGLDNPHQAFAMNATEGDVSGGLIYLCETMDNTQTDGIDIYIPNTSEFDNIYYIQGEFIANAPHLLPTGNNFAYGSSIDIRNIGDAEFTYFYYDAGTQEPRPPHTGYTPVNLEDPNPCAEEFCAPPCLDEEDITDLKEDYPVYRAAYFSAVSSYWTAIGEEDEEEAEEQSRIAGYYLRQGFKAAYDIVTHAWRDTVDYHIDTLIKWYRNLDTYGGDLMIAGEIAGDGRMSEAIDTLEAIPLHRELTTLQETDLANVIEIYTILDTTEIPDLSVDEKSIIRSIAQSDIGASSGIARSVLSFHGENHPLPYYSGKVNDPPVRYRSNEEDDEDSSSEENLSIYPVPSSDWVRIEWKILSPEGDFPSLLISNIHGQIVQKSTAFENSIVINVAEWNRGIYIATVRSSDGKQISKLFVVN